MNASNMQSAFDMSRQLPDTKAWQALADHYQALEGIHLRTLFDSDPERARRYAIELGPLYLDFSKNHLTDTTVSLLCQLADETGLKQAIDRLFSGDIVNVTENRAALHTALRAESNDTRIDPEVTAAVAHELQRMSELYQSLHNGQWPGFTGKPIDTVINIGIGGSDLGPRLLASALGEKQSTIEVYFVANLDPADLSDVLARCQPETTLFIISSKSFGTLETRSNYTAARHWLQTAGCSASEMQKHFLAATANVEAAVAEGISAENVFRFWDWVGGRYSVWSAAGLAGFLAVGPNRFQEFLAGGRLVDDHFQNMPWQQNLPVMLALVGAWYVNFFNAGNHVIVPYDHRLSLLPDYLCQLIMESNGKSVSVNDQPVSWQTTPVTWGGVGSNVQHSFFQALHQGTQLMPVDFLAPLTSDTQTDQRQRDLLLSCLAQSRALMCGSDQEQTHRSYPGNRPSNTLLYSRLSAEVLGALLAIYEHKTFVQAQLWQINPFDQWGVELGKKITGELAQQMDNGHSSENLDSSTHTLMQRYRRYNE